MVPIPQCMESMSEVLFSPPALLCSQCRTHQGSLVVRNGAMCEMLGEAGQMGRVIGTDRV